MAEIDQHESIVDEYTAGADGTVEEYFSEDDGQVDGKATTKKGKKAAVARKNKAVKKIVKKRAKVNGVKTHHRHKDYNSYNTFILRILKESSKDRSMNAAALSAYNEMVKDIICKTTKCAIELADHSGRRTISAKDIQAALKINVGVLGCPDNKLAPLMIDAGQKAAARFQSNIGSGGGKKKTASRGKGKGKSMSPGF
jgi:histone H3/H4